MVSFADLRDAQPGQLRLAADAWRQLSKDVGSLHDRVTGDLIGPIRRSGWAGRAAAAAYSIFDTRDDEVELAAMQFRNVAAVMGKAADELDQVHKQLLAAVAAAGEQGFRVTERGFVYAPRPSAAEYHDPDGQMIYRRKQQDASVLEDEINSLVAKASDLDFEFTRAARLFLPYFKGMMVNTEWNDATRDAQGVLELMGLPVQDIPRPGNDPNATAAWWRGLTDEQRSLYMAAYPDRVGALNGLPATARDQANRHALRDLIGQPDLRTYDNDKNDHHHTRLVSLLNQLEASETGPAAQRLFLLGIDNHADGKAIVAVGNPDTAQHTAVLVPGVGTELDGMAGQIDRAIRMQETGDGLTLGVNGDVSVIAWLGYDPPSGQETVAAPFGHHSRAGAEALDRFVDGLNVSHPGDSHITAVGHSYGSTLIGHAAAHGDGLAADDVVTVGSPGVRADHASDLNMGTSHVWAGAANDDQIANPQNHSKWYQGIPIIGGFLPGVEEDIHGISPHRAEFGANQFHVDTSGHGGYWDRNSESLRNQAAIIVGFYGDVTLDHGTVPR